MSGYVCNKMITLSGKQYVPGDVIPAEAILPSRVLALKRSNHIAEAEIEADAPDTQNSRQNSDFDSYPIELPISTPEGIVSAAVSTKTVAAVFSILQLPEKEAKTAISDLEDDDALMLMNAVERRKNVLSAVKERHSMLTEEAGGADGEDI